MSSSVGVEATTTRTYSHSSYFTSMMSITPSVTPTSSSPSPSWCNEEKCYYGILAAAGLLLCTTVMLTIALIVVLLRHRRLIVKNSDKVRENTTATTAPSTKRKDSSYWIECELDNSPREFRSTPNLSDWSSPPITRTFIPTLPLDDNSIQCERKTIAPSASMAPLVPPQRHVEQPLRVSTSHTDLSRPVHVDLRLSPIFPPIFPRKSPTPSTGEETPKPPKRKKRKKRTKPLSPDMQPLDSGERADLTSSVNLPSYVRMHKIPPNEISPPQDKSTTPSPIYQEINVVTRDPSSQYETIELKCRN